MTYQEFLNSKIVKAPELGLKEVGEMSEYLFPHQRKICEWAVRGGCRAIFAAFGLGKTLMQLQLCHSLVNDQNDRSLIICPLGVKQEFMRDAKKFFDIDLIYVRNDEEFEAAFELGHQYFITNYERVRDGKLAVGHFTVVSLDEASVLRSFGSKTYQEFLPLFSSVPYKFVATATPSPNRYKELIHYAGFLGIMDTGQALTRFFKRDPKKAGNLQLHPHKEKEFWMWVNSWACFIQKPSDLGFDDNGYDLPPLTVTEHRLNVDHSAAGVDSWGNVKMFKDATLDLKSASREKRDSLEDRIAKCIEIIEDSPQDHFIIWTDLNDEGKLIERYLKGKFGPDSYVTAHGATSAKDLDRRENDLIKFSEGKDGTKMGCGVSEKVFVFRKPQTDTTKGYADEPVIKDKKDYSRARWQLDANQLWRSNGDRFLTPEQIQSLQPATLKNAWEKHAANSIYSYEEHVKVLESRDQKGLLPSGFMLLHPHIQNSDIWEDVVRMRTLNTNQSQKQKEQHTCPLQFDVVERLINRYSNRGDLVLDPFSGLFTVAYCAVKMGRKGYGIELNPTYFADGVAYLKAIEHNLSTATLFDVAEFETQQLEMV